MKFFNNKLSRINFLILMGILAYLLMDISNNSYEAGIKKSSPSVINIIASNQTVSPLYNNPIQGKVAGSGIIISNDGYIITNFHILNGKQKIEVELDDGQIMPAIVIGHDQRSDLAVIKITSSEPLIPIKIVDSKTVRVGDEVIAIGNAFGLGKTFTSGIISATGRDYGNPYLELIQTDAAINPGNSGGALVNIKGNLIGMNTKIFSKTGSYTGIGFALPANKIIDVASEIIKYGSVKKSWVGDFRVKFKKFLLNNSLTYGLEILELKEQGPLYNDGRIKEGAIIITINSNIATWENLTSALNNSFPGDQITLGILQDKEIYEISLITQAMQN